MEIDLELGEIPPTSSLSSSPPRSGAPAVDLPEAGSPVEEGEWSRVADALRQGDTTRAEQELEKISTSADASQRDAALLAQAEFWLAHGERAKARIVLHRLAGAGATPFIRRRASQLLATSGQ